MLCDIRFFTCDFGLTDSKLIYAVVSVELLKQITQTQHPSVVEYKWSIRIWLAAYCFDLIFPN